MKEQAIEKLRKEMADNGETISKNKYFNIIAEPTLKALECFCEQNEEFAQAVVQSSGTFVDCLGEVMKKPKGAVSDIDVYSKAVEFYFSGAKVNFLMTIDVGDGGFSNSTAPAADETPRTEKPARLELDLSDLLG